MKNKTIEWLCKEWIAAKEVERSAVQARRELEDEMKSRLAFAENLEGVQITELGQFNIKVTGRLQRKIDSDKLQELAAEHGLSDHLPGLFRWKPEINMSVWKKTDEKITKPLLDAITTKPGRPSFQISTKTNKN
jgi:hypothetical protein